MNVQKEKSFDKKKYGYVKRNKKQKLGMVDQDKIKIYKSWNEEYEIKTNFAIENVIENHLYPEYIVPDTSRSTLRTTTSSFICDDYLPADKLRRNISPSDFEHLKVIGKGYFGKVTKVKYSIDSQIYALKSIKKNKLKEQKHIEHIKNERKILEIIDHPFLISLKFAFQSPTKLYLIMEFCNGGELFYHIRSRGHLQISEAKFYFSQIVLAIEYLHQKKIIYRDLKPENIVLNNNGYIKLTDLGLAKEGNQEDFVTGTFCGTPDYLAPEIIRGEKYGKSVDIWCLGILLYEMLYGFTPYYDKNKEKLYRKIIFNDIDFNPALKTNMNKIDVSDDAKDLISKLLKKNPKERLKIAALKSHIFFNDINFNDIINMKIEPPFKPDKESEKKFIDPKLNIEVPGDSLYNGLSPLNNKEFNEFTYAEKFINK